LYYDPQPGARDRILSRWGGFVDPIPFDPIRFGIPPASLRSITPSQLIALELTRRALLDAGYEHARPPADVRERTAVVFAIGNTGDFEQMYMTRAGLPLAVGTVDESVRERLPEWTEESYPGLLPSVTAGRVANRFDFGGPNLTIDAACASSLAALDVAVRELVDRRSDVVVAGGLDFEMSPQAFMGFSHTRALSPRGRADVFDRGADGIVISEGAVVLILKRLADAERDGDRVYAVIKGVAGSSDGRGLSMTAPKPAGQRLALTRAYARSGIDPGTLRLYEAHGTGTALGDAAEAQTITRLLTGAGAPEAAVAIGSAKSLVGHTRTAAGMVALLKAALALHHRVLPPHGGVSAPLAEVSDGPLALHREPRPWTAERGVPRRAGASAFGFGGTNFHVILEEHQREVGEAPVGAPVWPIELLVLAAPDAPGLQRALDRLDRAAERLQAMPADGSVPVPFTLRDLAYVAATEARNSGAHRVALVASSADELRARIAEARLALDGTPAAAGGVFVGAGAPAGSLGWLFPGQGSQHPGMGREAATYLADLRTAVEQVEQVMGERAVSVSRLMWPRAAFNPADEEASRRRLADTIVAQPAIGALSCGLADVLTRLGLAPAAVAGHSFGEFVALHAAGCLDRDALLTLAVERGRAMAAVGPDAGTMAMLAGDADAAAGWIHGLDGIVVANRNAPGQVVVSGTREAVQAAMARARADGRAATPLTVSGAFHSPLMKPARAALTDAIERVRFHSPRVPVFGNVDGRTYPVDEAAIASRLRQHLEDPVNFVDQIESMYAAGVRTFVEVGPGRVLTGLVRRILGDRPAVALATDGGLRALLEAVGALHAHGHAPDVVALFAGRPVRWVDFDRLPDLPSTPRDWWVDGARAWPATAAMPTTGAAPFVTADTLPHPSAVSGLPALPVVEQPEAALVSFYRTYEETMRRFLDQQERMLEQVLHLARGGHTMPATVVEAAPLRPGAALPAPAAPRREPATSEGRTANAMAARLVRILGERTGYTEDAIGLEYDLEADLGVDSIKRIEMIATFASSFPEDDARRLQASLDRLTRLRTLNAIAAAASAALADDVAAPAPASAAILSCPRLVVQLEERPVPANQREIAGFHLITEDALGVSPLVAKALADRGVPVAIVTLDDLRDESRLFERVSEWRRQFGPVRGVVHLTPLGRPPMADGEWEPELNATVRTLFSLLKLAANDLAGSPDGGRAFGAVLAATALGGTWGRDRCHAGAEIAGGCHGLLRSFAREYETVRTLVVDLDDRAAPPELAQHVMQEFATAADQEVGYREGRRRVPNLVDSPIRPDARVEHWRLESGSVVLATGGTRGITAEVCHAVAGPGVRFVLIGRPDTGAPNAERRQVVDRLTAAGAAVEIIGVDVADAAAFGAVIDDVYRRYGRIDGVLHGAGHIHDQRFELKSTAGYAEVFRAKVGGAFTLARHLKPDTVRWCVFFSSVSGRFGNAGQSDYAAANEILNRLAWSLHRRWGTARVVSINWGPWSGAGMLTASTLALVQSRGFQPIVPEAGRRFAREEIGAGSSADVEVIAGMPPSRGSTPPRG
jgi:acyl transferase domain-containing protein/NADP-dependent 3-hydroxy acid dehydrogenase YdfG